MRYEDASHTSAFQGSQPIANDDLDSLPAGSKTPATGNLITGEGTQTGSAGADMAAGAHVAAIAGKDGEDTSFSAGKLSVSGEHGRLSVDADGNYSYMANAGVENVRDRFTYTLADNQGATDTGALIVEIGKTPVVIKANAQQIVPGPDGVVTLPPGVELSDIRVVGRNLVVDMPDGTQLIIIDGAIFVPQLELGGVQVPSTNLAALLIGQEPQPAAGEAPQSGGGNFDVPVPPLDPGVPLGDLIPPTEYDYTPPEPEEVFDILDRDPEITIQPDGQPASVNAVDSVDEDGLPTRNEGEPEGSDEGADGNPSNNSDSDETAGGLILYSTPDGFDSIAINGVVITSVGQVIDGAYGTLTITSIADGQIGYSYTLDDNIDHSDGLPDHDDFSVVVTDDDGDSAGATLTINIIDDVPTARNDTDATVDGVATGNVMTDAAPGDAGDSDTNAADTVGADDAKLTAVSGAGGSDSTFSEGLLSVNGQFGVLTIDAQGNYTYTVNPNAGGGGVDVFTYTLTDGDGDTTTATLTITNPDLHPDLPNPEAVLLDDDALPGGNAGGDGDDPDSQGLPGQLIGSGGDGDLDYNFTGVNTLPAGFTTNVVDASTVQILQGATVVLTITLNNETGAFNVVQNNPIDHPVNSTTEDNLQFSIGVEVEDADGDVEPASIAINVDDDTPTVSVELNREGAVTVDESGPTGASTIDFGGTEGDDEHVAGSGPIGRAVGATAIVDANALFGADGPSGSGLTYSLQLGGSDTDLTLTDGSAIQLQLINGVIVGMVTEGAHSGEAAFAIAINPTTGVATVELYLSLDHPVNPDPNDSLPLGPNTVDVVVSATDGDGDTATSDPVDVSGLFNFLDDGPSVDPVLNAAATVTVDESLPSTAPAIDTGAIAKGDDPDLAGGQALGFATSGVAVVDANAAFGADGPAVGGVTHALSITNAASGVTLTDGSAINLVMQGGVIVGVVAAGAFAGQAAFAIAIDPSTGVVTVEQYLSLDHPVNPDPNDPLGLGDNTVAVTVTGTDGDGDPITSGAVDISGQISFLDDGPSIDPVVNAQATVTVDESLPSTAPAIDTGAIAKGDDPDLAGGLALGQANSGVAIVDANAVFGADGAAAGGGLAYALSITNANPGVTLTDGTTITMQLVGGVIVGVVDAGPFAGQAAFAIAIDPTTGVVSVEQYLSLDHPVNPDPNDPLGLGDNTVAVTVTATDGDGDPVTSGAIDISGQISFLDDGPTIDPVLDREATVTVDESLPSDGPGINTGAIVKGDDPHLAGGLALGQANSGSAIVDANAVFGADGAAAGGGISYALSITNASSGVTLTDGTAINLQMVGGVIVGVVAAGEFAGQAAFAIAIDPNTGVVTVEQYLSLDHPVNPDPNDPLGLGDDTVAVTVTATDGDGDPVTSGAIDISDNITFLDDGPTVDPTVNANSTVTVDESLPSTAPAISTGAIAKGDDPDLPGGFALGQANSGAAIVDANAVFGADGPAAGGGISYALSILNVSSGLTLTDGTPINLQLVGDVIVGVVNGGTFDGQAAFAIAIDPTTGVVSVEQYLSLDHPVNPDPNDPLGFGENVIGVTVTATDGDGDPVTSDAVDIGDQITFLDDGPVANNDVDSVVGGVGPATGNVLTGVEVAVPEDGNATDGVADAPGADGGTITNIDHASSPAAGVPNGGSVVIAGDYGVLTIYSNGDYSYLRNADSPGGVEDVFTYTLTDGDGDSVTATLTIGIDDNFPTLADPALVQLDDDALAGGNAGGTDDDADSAGLPGQLSGVGGDGDLDYNFTGLDSVPLGFTVNPVDASTVQILQGATVVLTITLNNDTGAFNVVQNNPIDHLEGDDENNYDFSIGVEVEDNDGDVEPASITINVDDDTPVLQNVTSGAGVDVDETDAGSPAGFPISDTSTDPVIDADALFGADGPAAVNSTVYGLSIVGGSPEPSGLQTAIGNFAITLVAIDGDTIEGQYQDGGTQVAFTIQMNADGTVTLTQEVPLEHLVDGAPGAPHNDTLDLSGLINATITITDGDGDTASASAPIGDNLVFFDDGPDAQVDGQATLDQLVLDETRPVDSDSDSGDSDPAGLATVQANFADNFVSPVDYGGDGAGTTAYSLVLSENGIGSGLYALDNTDTETVVDGYGQGDEITLSQVGNVITGSANGTDYFTITINPATGVVTFTQLANVWHANTSDDDDTSSLMTEAAAGIQVVQTVTDSDGDFDTASVNVGQGVFHIEDDGPEIIAVDNVLDISNTGTTPTGEGAFDFDIGTDAPNGGSGDQDPDDISLSNFNIQVNGADADNVVLTEGPEDASTASYSFTFDYDTGNGGTAQGTGNLVFDKAAGTYTVELTSGPIEGFSIVSTATGADPVFYNNEHIGIVEVADGLFMQFTGFSSATGPNPFGNDDVFGGTDDNVHISSTEIGVHGNALQDSEVVDFEFMTSDPGAVDADPSATAGTAFIQLGQFNSSNPEDVVVVLKLADPNDPSNFITRTIIVEGGDILDSQADIPAGFPTLGTNEAMIIISPEDYIGLPGVPDNYEIAGMQIRPSTEGLSSTAGEVYNFDGDVGEADNSAAAFGAGTNDNDVLKIVNIGAVIESTEDQSATISFDVTIHDADGDTQTESITVNIGDPPADALAATSFSTSQEEQLQKSAANSNTLTLAAAVAAAGMAEQAAAAPVHDNSGRGHDNAETVSGGAHHVAASVSANDDSGNSAMSNEAPEAANDSAPVESSSHRSAPAESDHSLDDGSAKAEAQSSDVPTANDQGPASSSVEASPAALAVGMPSVEALQAAGVAGNAQHGGSVEQIVADALGQGNASAAVDALLNALPGGNGAHGALANMASVDAATVPAWHMSGHGAFANGHDMMFNVHAAMQHHDAVQPVANG